MKIKFFLGALAVMISYQPAQAVSLKEAMATAYLNNPALRAKRASLRAVDETINQAKSGWRPSLTATANYGRKRSDSNISFFTSRNTTPRQWGLELKQPVFQSMQTVNSTSEARNRVEAARQQLVAEEQKILLDSVTAYMGVLRDIAVLNLTINNVNVLERQLQASKDRFRVGDVTRTDVAQSKARLSRAISERIRSEATLISSRAAYRKTVGNAPVNIKKPANLPAMPASEDAALAIAKRKNPQLLAALYIEKAAGYNVKRQYGSLGPSVDIIARINKSWERYSTNDVSVNKEILAQVTMPLYQSGAASSRIRQSRQVEEQRRLEAEATERDVVERVRNAWEGYREATARIVSTEDQVTANNIAYKGVKQEARVGSRTTLNVLNAEQELLNSRVSLVKAQRDQYVAAYSLLSAIGDLTARSLKLDVSRYDPARNTRAVENKFYGWGIDRN